MFIQAGYCLFQWDYNQCNKLIYLGQDVACEQMSPIFAHQEEKIGYSCSQVVVKETHQV